MKKELQVAIGQLNLNAGDFEGNFENIGKACEFARDQLLADIIVFPELSITSYMVEDLLLRDSFIQLAETTLQRLAQKIKDIYILVGFPEKKAGRLYNACALLYNGEIIKKYAKRELPNYGVFDEKRYFTPGEYPLVVDIKGIPVGIMICEDAWNKERVKEVVANGAKCLLSMNASPFEVNKAAIRRDLIQNYAKDYAMPVVYVNNVGGQDDLIFDGGSMVANEKGEIAVQAEFFKESIVKVTFDYENEKVTVREKAALPALSFEATLYQALCFGLREYVVKNNFKTVILGVSGGIDSALVAAIAADALAPDQVEGILLPSRYTEVMSVEDAKLLCHHLKIKTQTFSIEPCFTAFLTLLGEKEGSITAENLQSRSRAVILMALSNKTGALLLSTSNRSELAMGYGTLYGDMAGGFNVLKDIPKTWVYRLAHYRNHLSPVIPERILTRPPTAELAHGQKDQDTLPPYEILDEILALYIEQEKSVKDIINLGFAAKTVHFVVDRLYKNEFKRRLACVGIRIQHKAFGRDRRYPMTCHYFEK